MLRSAAVLCSLAAAALAALGVIRLIQRVRRGGGCCGEHKAAEKRVRVRDRDPAHYPYHYEADIGGMVCANCARRVENAFNRKDGFWARVDLAEKRAIVLSGREIERKEAAELLRSASYTLLDWREGRRKEGGDR